MNSEFTDLLTFLAIICVPILAIGVAFNLRGPLGRALANWIRDAPDGQELAAMETRLDLRLQALEQAVGSIAVEVERVGEQQRALLARPQPALQAERRSPLPGPPRVRNTPH